MDKELIIDAIIHDNVISNPVVTLVDDQADVIINLEIDVSFSNLIITSDMNVSFCIG